MDTQIVLIAFFLVILLSNIIQGVTGFAGTLLAMPFIIMILDLDTAKITLNAFGIFASVLIVYKDFKYINVKELKKIILLMFLGVVAGLISYNLLPYDLLVKAYPIFLLYVGGKGIFDLYSTKRRRVLSKHVTKLKEVITLLLAGIMHGLYISGGPLLVVYATQKFNEKRPFRVTLSMVWIILNSLIFIENLASNKISMNSWFLILFGIVPLFAGVYVGGKLISRISRRNFLLLSFCLLIFSAISMYI